MSLAEGPSPDSIGEEGQEDALSIQHKIGGKPLTECIATGSWEEQAQGHAYLFSQANAVGDTSKRHSLHLAHLASERANHTSTVIRPLSKMMRSAFCFEQMLAHKQEITKGEHGERLYIDTDQLSDVFLQFAEDCRGIREQLQRKHGEASVEGWPQESLSIILAAQRTVMNFFGLINEHSPRKNLAKYGEGRAVALHEFEKERSAICTEYSLLAQQLLAFAGMKTAFISGGYMATADEQWAFEPENNGHAFLLVSAQKPDGTIVQYVFDPANPLITKSGTDPTHYELDPFFAPFDAEGYAAFLRHSPAGLEFKGTRRIYNLS